MGGGHRATVPRRTGGAGGRPGLRDGSDEGGGARSGGSRVAGGCGGGQGGDGESGATRLGLGRAGLKGLGGRPVADAQARPAMEGHDGATDHEEDDGAEDQ